MTLSAAYRNKADGGMEVDIDIRCLGFVKAVTRSFQPSVVAVEALPSPLSLAIYIANSR